MDLEAIFRAFPTRTDEPDWREPNDFYRLEASQLISPAGNASDGREHRGWPGLDIDPALALRLLEMKLDGNFNAYARWLLPDKSLIVPPKKTCPNLPEAGAALGEALAGGQVVAVYCDYDVDGTAAGEILRRGLYPYCPRSLRLEEAATPEEGPVLIYGYADAQRGFGLTSEFVKRASEAGASVLVTLDCGTSQDEQVRQAQALGMRVIVVDHHTLAENPADFHLNPKLGWDGRGNVATSDNTGAQLAWKLAAAVQCAREGRTRPEHWQEALQLGGMGCLADMGSVLLHENRAFFWCAHRNVVPGVRALARTLGEDPELPGGMILTQAALNLPKRTTHVDASDIGALLAASSEEAAAPIVEKIVRVYEEARPKKSAMVEQALAQTGRARRTDDGNLERPRTKEHFAVAILGPEFADYVGYSGPVAQEVSKATGKPALVFTYRGLDEDGREIYKFSSRNASGNDFLLGKELLEDDALRAACTFNSRDESGKLKERIILGGHEAVVSGGCTKEAVSRVVAAFESRAEVFSKDNPFWPTPYNGPEAILQERKVSPLRLRRLEEEARHLAPFTYSKQDLLPSGKIRRQARNKEVQVSLVGTLRLLGPSDREGWLRGELDFGDGITREVRYPADASRKPEGQLCEWVLRIGRGAPYWLRTYHLGTTVAER